MSKVALTTPDKAVWIEFSKDKNGVSTKKETPMSEMTDAQLKRAKKFAQAQILKYFNKASQFDLLVEQLEDEAESRGTSLEDYDRDYFKNEKMLKSKIKTPKK